MCLCWSYGELSCLFCPRTWSKHDIHTRDALSCYTTWPSTFLRLLQPRLHFFPLFFFITFLSSFIPKNTSCPDIETTPVLTSIPNNRTYDGTIQTKHWLYHFLVLCALIVGPAQTITSCQFQILRFVSETTQSWMQSSYHSANLITHRLTCTKGHPSCL